MKKFKSIPSELQLISKIIRKFCLPALFLLCRGGEINVSATVVYWDPEGTNTPTAANLTGTWDTTGKFSTTSTQTASPIAFFGGDAVCFCAGSTAVTTPFTVTLNSTAQVAGVFNGPLSPPGFFVTLSGTGSLQLISGACAFDTGGTDGGTTTIAVPITGAGQVAFEGSAQIFFNATNTYTGGTTFGYPGVASFSSIVNINNGNAFGTGPLQITSSAGGGALVVESNLTVTITNAVIATNVSFNLVGSTGGLTFTGPWSLGATPNIGSGGANNLVTISGKMSGTGGFTKYNSSTLVLSGTNTYTGITTVSNGVLSITADNNLGTAPATATLDLVLAGGALNASNTFTLNSNRLLIMTANSTLSVSPGKVLTYGGTISGTYALAKTNGGTLVLLGTNTYTGGTFITSGTVEADTSNDSSLATNSVTLQTAGTLSGTGFVGGAVVGNGTIAPGTLAAGAGTLTLGNGLDLSSGGTFAWNLSTNSTTTGFSVISLTAGNLNLGGSSTLSINFSGSATAPSYTNAFWQSPQTWTIVSLSGSAGNSNATGFASISNGNYPAGNFTSYLNGSGNIVLQYLPNFPVLDTLYDFGHGLFGGENLGFTNFSGLAFYAWSATNLSLAVSNWTPLGELQEHSLAPALTGESRYTFNVAPTVSPTYVIAGNVNTGPYIIATVPFTMLTTSDFSTFSVLTTNSAITTNGVINPPAPIILPGSAYSRSGFQLQFNAFPNQNYVIQASTNLVYWTNIGSGTVTSSPTLFNDAGATNHLTQFYRVVLP